MHPRAAASDKVEIDDLAHVAAVAANQSKAKPDRPIGRRSPNYKTKPIIVAGPQ
jgi:hypothetical protein